MSAVGIDLGGGTALIAVAKKGGVDVVVNDASNRETPIVVGFGENERFIGEQGYVQLKSNFKNTVVFPNRFLGLRPEAPFFNEEKKWLYNNTNVDADGRFIFDVAYRGERRQFLPEQLTAMLLQKLKHIVRKNDVSHNDMVISVPNYYTSQERKALLDAAKIAQINVVKLMNESTAIALGYGIFRKAELSETARNVIFVDFGHTNTSVFVASLTSAKVKILNQVHERNLGVRDIDWKLLEFYSKICVDQFDSNPMKKEKTRLRLIDAIEKQRKVLSANIEAGINVDYIAEDNDLSYSLTREKLEEIATPVVARFRSLLEAFKGDVKVPIHSIEIVGGGTRIPAIQRALQEVFGMDLSRTLNASEAIARGCAIQAAMMSPLFKVAQYEIEESNYYPIRCSWFFKDNSNMNIESDAKNNPEKQTSVLFDKGCSIPNIKAVTFHREEAIDFKLFYDPVPPGADALLLQFLVPPAKPKDKDFGVKIRVTLNKNCIIEFDSANLNEEYDEITPPPATTQATPSDDKMAEEKPEGEKEKPKQPTPAAKPDIKRKTRTTKLNVETLNADNIPATKIGQLTEEERQMENADRVAHETYARKNDLETYIYDMRSKLHDKYDVYAKADTKHTLLQALEAAENWLYSEGAKTTINTYVEKLNELKKHGDPISNRYKEYESIPEALTDFNRNLGVYESIVNSADPNYEHITVDERRPLADAINEHRGWMESLHSSMATHQRAENLPFSTQDVLSKHKAFVDKHYSTINKPKPKPQAQPKPEEAAQNKEGAQDTGAEQTQDAAGEPKEMDIEK